MSDQVNDASVEAEAAGLVRRLHRRADLAGLIGVLLYASLEIIRIAYWPTASKWTISGWLIPFQGLACLLASISYESMKTTLKERGYSGETARREQTVYLLLQRQDEEGLRLVRGLATAGAVYAFVLGMVMSGVART